MHGVVLTSVFERQATQIGLSEDEVLEIVAVIAADPLAGDLMKGTGGARKLRHAGRGHGKSGGYRTIHYFGGDDVPVFLLAVLSKGTGPISLSRNATVWRPSSHGSPQPIGQGAEHEPPWTGSDRERQ